MKPFVERAVILIPDDKLQISGLSGSGLKNESGKTEKTFNLEKIEKKTIRSAIDRVKGNYSKAALLLGVSRKTLYNKIEKYGI